VASVPDLNKSIQDHRAQLPTWWSDPRYRAAVEKLKVAKPFCRCGRPTTTALHESTDYAKGFEHYVRVVENLTVRAGCQRCNREEQRNRRPCPECIKAYAKDHSWTIRYITHEAYVCLEHDPDRDAILRDAATRKTSRTATARFPCRFRATGQGCDNEKHIGACERSAKTAEGCDHFGRRDT
jgi:hypothetical protein